MAKRWAVIQQEAILRKQTFFDPTYDPVFKKIFEKKATLIHFLNAILHFEKGHEISRIETLKKNVKLSKAKEGDESVCFDVHACTADGSFIDIEMQRAEHEDFRDRVDLYSSLLAINAKITMDKDSTTEQQADHPYLMPNVYSIWLCNFDVDFCNSYREELGVFRFSDLGCPNALPIFPKKRYIIVDITKFVPGKGNTLERQWIELFKLMPTAKRIPANIDSVLKDVYERLQVKNSPKRFIAKVAKDMVDKREISTRLGTARREGAEQERKKFEAEKQKMAEYFRSRGVPEDVISGGFAIK
jgi:predicted transposase/invertase (TIGR01784 family)